MFKKRFLYEEEEVELNDFQKIIAINKRKIHPSDVEFKTSDGEDFSDVISIDYDGIHFKFDRLSEFLKFFFPNEYGDDSDGGYDADDYDAMYRGQWDWYDDFYNRSHDDWKEDYIVGSFKSKSLKKLKEILNIFFPDIAKYIVQKNELNSIGAQYLIKNVTWKFWNRIENDSEQLFQQITDLNNLKLLEDSSYHTVQIWCADMWSLLWNGWKYGKKTICHPDLDFSWATSPKEQLDLYGIFHNAGVTNNTSRFFYKSDYITEYPYNKTLDIDENTCSYFYWQQIQKTAKKSVLL